MTECRKFHPIYMYMIKVADGLMDRRLDRKFSLTTVDGINFGKGM